MAGDDDGSTVHAPGSVEFWMELFSDPRFALPGRLLQIVIGLVIAVGACGFADAVWRSDGSAADRWGMIDCGIVFVLSFWFDD